jgi:hypothetical protein
MYPPQVPFQHFATADTLPIKAFLILKKKIFNGGNMSHPGPALLGYLEHN